MSENPELEPTIIERVPRTDPAVLQKLRSDHIQIQHYAVIGMIASEWAFFESSIDVALTDFSNLNAPIAVCFTGQMIGHRGRLEAFIAMCRFLGAADKWNKVLEDFAKDAMGLSDQRNRAVHDAWQFPLDRPSRFEASAKRKVKFELIHVPTAELYDLVGHITALTSRFESQIVAPLYDELLPSIEKGLPKQAP